MKHILTATAIIACPLLLTACFSEMDIDKLVDENTVDSQEVRYSNFQKLENKSKASNYYTARVNYVYRDGQAQRSSTVVTGDGDGANFASDMTDNSYYINLYSNYDLAKDFYGANFSSTFGGTDEAFHAKLAKTIDVLSPTEYTSHIKSDTDDKTLTFTNKLAAIDISGLGSADYQKIYFAQDSLELEGTTFKFPQGSTCYVYESVKPSFNVFQTHLPNSTVPTDTLANWVTYYTKWYNYPLSNVVKVGKDNKYSGQYAVNNHHIHKKGVIDFSDRVSAASYLDTDGIQINSVLDNDPATERVECWNYNDTAADYLESLMKATANSDEVRYTRFDIKTNNSKTTTPRYAVRQDYVYRDGQAQLTNTVFAGDGEGADINRDSDGYFINLYPNYDLNNNFYGEDFSSTFAGTKDEFNTALAKTIDIISPTEYTSHIKSDGTGNKTLTFSNKLAAIDISGLGSADYQKIYFQMDPLGLEGKTLVFPQGSKCYVYESVKPSFNVFQTHLPNSTVPTDTLANWVTYYTKWYNYPLSNVVKVGKDNKYSGQYAVNNHHIHKKGVIDFSDRVSAASYLDTEGIQINSVLDNDPATERVECWNYNDIAANYLETQIKNKSNILNTP